MKHALWLLAVIALALPAASGAPAPATAPAIDVRHTPRTKESPDVWAWTVAPQPPPRERALKYTLVPPAEERTPGNAAALYRIALILHEPPNLKEQYPGRDIQEAQEYLAMPIAQMPLEDAKVHIHGSAMDHLDWAARRAELEWGWPVREQGIAVLLPELNEMRQLANKLRLRARIEILEGRYDDAVRTLQTGFAMGRDVSTDSVLVSALVGTAITAGMLQQVREFTAAPDAPNLYWALADLPRLSPRMRQIMEAEALIVRGTFPALENARSDQFSIEQWQRSFEQLHGFAPMLGGHPTALTAGGAAAEFQRRFAVATITAAALPRAKRYLAHSGMTEEQMDALGPVQAVAIYFVEQYHQQWDEFMKWMRLPFHVAYPHYDEMVEQFTRARRAEPLNPLIAALLPATHHAWATLARVDREIDALQAVEAIRAYAADHGGRLPESLDAVTATPVPLDPMTGQPFGYEVKGDTFILTAPPVDGRIDRALRYEVTIRSG